MIRFGPMVFPAVLVLLLTTAGVLAVGPLCLRRASFGKLES